MGKKSVVVTIMESRLSPYGFRYENYLGGRWTFKRFEGEDAQYVVVQKSNWSDSYTLEIHVNEGSSRMHTFTDGDPEYAGDFWDYHSEEERSAVLNKFADAIIRYGIDELNKETEEKKARGERLKPTRQMCEMLYKQNAALTEFFMEQNSATELAEDEILQLLINRMKELKGKTYEDVQNELVEITAVFGNMVISKIGGLWWLEDSETGSSAGIEISLFCHLPILKDFVAVWQYGNEEEIIKEISYMYNIYCSRVIEWVEACRKEAGPDWKPDRAYARWEIPF